MKGLVVLLMLLQSSAAMANGISIQKNIKPNLVGNYIVRAKLQTTGNDQLIRFGVFHTTKNNSIGKLVEGLTLRPQIVFARAGIPKPVIVTILYDSVNPKEKLALCMWKDEKTTESASSQLRLQSRYCRLFNLTPGPNPIQSTTAIP